MEVQYSKNYFKNFLPQEAGAFGNNTEKEPQKPCPKFKKCAYYIFTELIFAMSAIQCKWQFFLQKCINFLE